MSDKGQDVAGPEYYSQASRWEASVYRDKAAALVVWRLLALALGLGLALAIGALWSLVPLKSFEVVTLLVDKTTGHLEVARPLEKSGALTQNDAVTSANVVRFIRARESFDPNVAAMQNNYDLAVLYSTGQAQKNILRDYDASNSKSMLKQYGTDTSVTVFVKAVVRINADTFNVRFDTTKHPAHGAEVTESWVANIRFKYTNAPMRTDYRFDNPLGFQVTDYHRDQEMVGPVPSVNAADPAGTTNSAGGQP